MCCGASIARRLAWALAGLALLAGVGRAPARAAFPGRNGELVLAAPCGGRPVAGCHGLELVRPDGSGRRLLCPNVRLCASAGAPEFSPDGQRVGFVSSYETYVVYLDGSCFSCVAPAADAYGRPAWTGDGRHLLEVGEFGPVLYDDDGLVDSYGPRTGDATFYSPAISAREVLAFARAASRPARRDLFLVGLRRGRPRRLTTAGGGQPAWSPDGSRLAFVDAHDIYLVRADGRGPRLLARDGSGPAFSPDGRFVAFVRRHGHAPGRVLIISARGGRARVVPGARADELDWQPVVAPKPASCAFGKGARIVASSAGVVIATRIISIDNYGQPSGQVWLTCSSVQRTPRVLSIAQVDGSSQELDAVGDFMIIGSWIAFTASSAASRTSSSTSIESLDALTGVPQPAAASFYSDGGTALGEFLDEFTLDPSGDVAWIATGNGGPFGPGPGPPGPSMDQLGLDDARGTHILEQGATGTLTDLKLGGTSVTWLDRGQRRSAAVVPKRG